MVISLIFLIMLIMQSLFIYTDYNRTFARTKETSLSTAKMLSYMDSIQEAVLTGDEPGDLKPLIDYYEANTDAAFILVKSKKGDFLAHPDKTAIGEVMPLDNEYNAVVFGAYYTVLSDEMSEMSIIGIAPILNKEQQVIGIVKVGYFVNDLYGAIIERSKKLLYITIWVFMAAILSSILLARSIRKDTLGLEPKQIAELYTERHAILSSISEGVIAIDKAGRIVMMNLAAKRILGLAHEQLDQSIDAVVPGLSVEKFKNLQTSSHSLEMTVNEKVLIFNTAPLRKDITRIGTVITFRDKTEMVEIVNRLFEVSRYSEDLRAQTHEFANKLYVISGLLQLGEYDEAILMLQEEIEINEATNQLIFEQIKDPNVQAILLGKMSKASESKLTFTIDDNSTLEMLPSFIRTGSLSSILGNLLDNAFEAVVGKENGTVSFFALDMGDDIIFEVTDNGDGIPPERMDDIFKQKYTTKSNGNRGFGLTNVQQIVHELNGDIQVDSSEQGTTFSVYIPKH